MNKTKSKPLTDDIPSCWWPVIKWFRMGKLMGVSTFPSTVAQEMLMTSLGSLFLSARGLGPSVASLWSSWVFSASPVHSGHLLPLLFTPIAAALCWLLASTTHPVSSSSQQWCWVLGSCSLVRWGGGGGLPGGVSRCSGLLASCFVILLLWLRWELSINKQSSHHMLAHWQRLSGYLYKLEV